MTPRLVVVAVLGVAALALASRSQAQEPRVRAESCSVSVGGGVSGSTIIINCLTDEMRANLVRPYEELAEVQKKLIARLEAELEQNKRQIRSALEEFGQKNLPSDERLAAKLVEIAERLKLSQATALGQPGADATTAAPKPEWFEVTTAPGWACDLKQTEYVCEKGKPPFVAVAVIAVKRRGPEDNLDAYEEHFRTLQPDHGVPLTIRSVERRKLAGYEWVETIQLSSEVRNYITIYLATAISQVGVLATFSIHKDYYNERDVWREIVTMMSTLKIYQQGP